MICLSLPTFWPFYLPMIRHCSPRQTVSLSCVILLMSNLRKYAIFSVLTSSCSTLIKQKCFFFYLIKWRRSGDLCNSNNGPLLDPSLIKKISLTTNYDDIPAVKFLGIYFDSSLTFKYQIQNIRKKLSKALYVLRMVKNLLPLKSLKLIYYSIFHCHLIYAIQIWSCCSPSSLNDLFKLQKTALRIICNTPYNSHTEPLFKREEILPLPDLITFFKIQFIQRFSQQFLPVSFENVWSLNRMRNIGDNDLQLRNNEQYDLPPPDWPLQIASLPFPF